MTGHCNLPAQGDHAGWVAHYQNKLRPCGEKTGTAELTACLTLVAPTGMSASEREAWLKVARFTLKGMPKDLLQAGCRHAREHADHPSRVVPHIMRHAGILWEERKAALRDAQRQLEEARTPKLESAGLAPIPHEETQRIIAEAAREAQQKRKGPLDAAQIR